MDALKPKKRGIKIGKNRTLSSEQEKEVIKMITKKNSYQLRLKCCLWTRYAHHSKAVAAWVEEHKKQIALFHLPPYSPEYNPDEYLNHDLKQSISHREMVKDKDELELRANDFMDNLASDSEHIKSYFEHPKLDDYDEI